MENAITVFESLSAHRSMLPHEVWNTFQFRVNKVGFSYKMCAISFSVFEEIVQYSSSFLCYGNAQSLL